MAERCIYADDFLDLFYVASAGQDKMFVKVVEQVVEDTPTADVVEVVRCKDCKHSREQDRVFGITDYKCSKHNISCLSPYDFCSYGERSDT